MRNSGSILGGAINFATNRDNTKAGGVTPLTYLIFVAIGMLFRANAAYISCRRHIHPGDSLRVYWRLPCLEPIPLPTCATKRRFQSCCLPQKNLEK